MEPNYIETQTHFRFACTTRQTTNECWRCWPTNNQTELLPAPILSAKYKTKIYSLSSFSHLAQITTAAPTAYGVSRLPHGRGAVLLIRKIYNNTPDYDLLVETQPWWPKYRLGSGWESLKLFPHAVFCICFSRAVRDFCELGNSFHVLGISNNPATPRHSTIMTIE